MKNDLVPIPKVEKGTNFGDRLKKLIGNKSGRAFAKEIGISYSTLHNYLTNVSSPTLANLELIADKTNADIKWLVTGTVPDVIEMEEGRDLESKGSINLLNNAESVVFIDAYRSINVSAGFGSFNDGVTRPDGERPYAIQLLVELGVSASKCAVFWAKGNSMYPTIHDGDQLLVDLSQKQITGNKIYLIQNEDSVWVKRVKISWDGVELISDNKEEYPIIKIKPNEAEHLQVIGQVIYVGHALI